MQTSDPSSPGRMICLIFMQLFFIPITLLFYPVWVMMAAFFNPFNMPKKYRWMCFCKEVSDHHNNVFLSCGMLLVFFPIVVAIGLAIGVLNLVIFIVPAYLMKIYTLLKMLLFWRCMCCLNRHRN